MKYSNKKLNIYRLHFDQADLKYMKRKKRLKIKMVMYRYFHLIKITKLLSLRMIYNKNELKAQMIYLISKRYKKNKHEIDAQDNRNNN